MESGGIAPLDVQAALPRKKVAALTFALEDVFSSDKTWILQRKEKHFAFAFPSRSLAGPELGAGQPGSCPEHQPITGAITSLK
jgi:hypothetical protein